MGRGKSVRSAELGSAKRSSSMTESSRMRLAPCARNDGGDFELLMFMLLQKSGS